ncbi:MAG: YhfC family intramembrane metalloprotease [Faecousia sp.]
MEVSNLTIAVLAFNALLGLVLPLGLLFLLWKKLPSPVTPFFAGCLTFFLAVMVLESLVHSLVLTGPFGQKIWETPWLYALYGGLAAGVFEESGRLAAMKLLKKKYPQPQTALMYGAGHGGIEVLLVMGVTMAQNLMYALMVNAGQTEAILSTVPQAQAEVLASGLEGLATTPAALFLLSPVERVIALVLHMSLSILVWQAATQSGKFHLYFAAIGVHALVDASAALMQQYGIPVLLIELWLAVIDVAMVFWAKAICKSMHRAQ